MISRRQLLRVGLIVCGCATCGGLGMGAVAHSARADSASAMKGTAAAKDVMKAKTVGAYRVEGLSLRPHVVHDQRKAPFHGRFLHRLPRCTTGKSAGFAPLRMRPT
jgi:hypothetical protein